MYEKAHVLLIAARLLLTLVVLDVDYNPFVVYYNRSSTLGIPLYYGEELALAYRLSATYMDQNAESL